MENQELVKINLTKMKPTFAHKTIHGLVSNAPSQSVKLMNILFSLDHSELKSLSMNAGLNLK